MMIVPVRNTTPALKNTARNLASEGINVADDLRSSTMGLRGRYFIYNEVRLSTWRPYKASANFYTSFFSLSLGKAEDC